MKFKVGDRVRILRKARALERGWENSWEDDMTKWVGKIGRVAAVRSGLAHDVSVRIRGSINSWGFPDFVLRKLPKVALKRAIKKPRRRS